MANISDRVTTSLVADDTITSAKITDLTIVNADVSASAAIAGSKIDPNFGSQTIETTGSLGVGGTPTAEFQVFTGATSTVDFSAADTYLQVGAITTNNGPTLLSNVHTSNANGLTIDVGSHDTNSEADIMMRVRENDNSDFATTSTPIFKLRRFATDLLSVTRAGDFDFQSGDLTTTGTIGCGAISSTGLLTITKADTTPYSATSLVNNCILLDNTTTGANHTVAAYFRVRDVSAVAQGIAVQVESQTNAKSRMTWNTLGTQTGELMTLTSDGFFGINETSPSTYLHVTGPNGAGTTPSLGTDAVAVFENSANTGDNCQVYLLAGATGTSSLYFGYTGDGDTASIQYFHNTGSGGYFQFEIDDIAQWYMEEGFYAVGATGTNKGTGTINAKAVYDDNVLLTCYVIEQETTGSIDLEKWNAVSPTVHQGAMRYLDYGFDPLDLDAYEASWRSRKALPAFPKYEDWDMEKAETSLSVGQLGQRLWETVEIQAVHIAKLNERLKKLESK